MRVGADEPQLALEPCHELDVVAEQRLKHAGHVPDELVQIDRRGRRRRPAASGEDLLGQGRAPLGGPLDGFRVTPQRIVRAKAPQHHFRIAGDDREQIVEVVRDAARVSTQACDVGERLFEPRARVARGHGSAFRCHRKSSGAMGGSATSGRTIVNVVPRPGALVKVILPPWSWTILWARARPSPVPPERVV